MQTGLDPQNAPRSPAGPKHQALAPAHSPAAARDPLQKSGGNQWRQESGAHEGLQFPSPSQVNKMICSLHP